MAQRRKRRNIEQGHIYSNNARAIRKDFTRIYGLKTEKALLKAYKKYAKMADQRLVRLEKAAKTPGFENITSYSYRVAKENINAWDIMGRRSKGQNMKDYVYPRFNRNIPMTKEGKVDIAALKSKLTDIERFLISPTSSLAGTKEVYQSRADTLNRKYRLRGDARLTYQDMYNYYHSDLADVMKEAGYGSDTIIKAIATIKHSIKKRKDPDQIKKISANNINITYTKDANVKLVAKEMIKQAKERGIDLSLMFGDVIE